MFKLLKTKQGQAAYTEYAITFFMIVGIIMAMGTYVKRSVQGRIYSAHRSAFEDINAVFRNPAHNFQGGIWAQYEPYYVANAMSLQRYTDRQETVVLPAGRDGIVEYRDSGRKVYTSNKQQLAPVDAD